MPQPRDDEVVGKVHAASVNPVDAKMRWSMTDMKHRPRWQSPQERADDRS